MISIYLSHRSADFRKELYYRRLEDLPDGGSWRCALDKWVRIQQRITSEHPYVRLAVVDEAALNIVATIDMDNGEIIDKQIPDRESLFE